MKRLCALGLILVLLCSLGSATAAVDVEQAMGQLTDDDLFILQYYLLLEMRSRGLEDSDNSLLSLLEGGTSTTQSSVMVWVTKSGTKYHRSQTCGSNTCVKQLTLEEALSQGYAPCGRCNPPTK